MKETLDQICKETTLLSKEEKEQLVDFLLEEIYTPDEIEAAWLEELERRANNADEGKATFLSWDDVKSKYERYFEKDNSQR